MRMLHFTRRLGAVVVALVALALLAAACSGGDGEDRGPVLTPVTAAYLPQTVSSDVTVGPNRFVVGLLDQEQNAPVLGADLHFRFFKLEGDEQILKTEADARAVTIERSYTHTHDDGTVESHEAGETGAYVADVSFDSPGTWGIEVTGTVEGQAIDAVKPIFTVRERSLSPVLGEPAPRTVQTILGDVSDIAEIDTSDPPNPGMHDITIADAVTSGQPSVIVFATPAFCASRICGPTKDLVDQLYQRYQEQANFVHVEPYDIERTRRGDCASLFECRVPAVDEWGLQTEPWVFLVDSEGNIAAKFESIVTLDELEATLTTLLTP